MNQPTTFIPTDIAQYEEWKKRWATFLVTAASAPTIENVRVTEDLNAFEGNIDPRQFAYITEQYGLRTPARLVNYPLLNRMVNFLVNETAGESIDVGVECVDESVISEQMEKISKAAAEVLLRPLRRQLEKEIKTQLPDEQMNIPMPENIEEFMNIDWKAEMEVGMQWALRYMNLTYSLDDLYQQGMKDLVLSYREIYDVSCGDKDPKVRRVDPRTVKYASGPGINWIQDSPWVCEEELMPIALFLQEFKQHLIGKPQLLEKLNNAQRGDIPQGWVDKRFYYEQNSAGYIRVVRYRWVAIRPLTYKFNPNPYAPGTFFVKKENDGYAGKDARQFPVEDVFEGVWAVDEHIYCDRRMNQVRKPGNYARASHGYVGCVKDTISLTQMIKNLLFFYNIVMYHIEATMNRAGGKAVVYDMAQKPDNISTKEVFYHAKEGGLILINSSKEGMGLLNRQGFNQFQSVDFTLSNSLTQLVNLKMVIEQTAERFVGMNDSAMGLAKADEAVGVNQSKVKAASLITKNLFDDHYKVVEMVSTEIIGQLKYHWPKDKEKVLRMFGQRGLQLFKFQGPWLSHEYGLYIKNNRRERELKEYITRTAERSHISGQIPLEDFLKVINSTNSREMERTFRNGVKVMQKMQQQAAEAQNALSQKDLELKEKAIMSRIEAARIEAQAYVETQKMKMAMDQDGNIRDNMVKVNAVAQESREALRPMTAPSTSMMPPESEMPDESMMQPV